jgi:YegS/Rv2252/BmrU family lipid kinase
MIQKESFDVGERLYIVNPNAGSRKGLKDLPKISGLLKKEELNGDFVMTEHRDHASQLAEEAIGKGCRTIIVIGGDGTMNEVVNGIFQQTGIPSSEITLGMIPVGTGNDWCRTFNIPFDYPGAIRRLNEGKTMLQDVGKVQYHKGEEMKNRYFINIAGMGYDALVAKKTNIRKEQGRGGPLSYFYFIFASLFQYKFPELVLEVDDKKVFEGKLFSMNVGICKYSGGGMMQVPGAVPDDGLMDVTLIRKTSKFMVVRYTRKLYDGTLVNLPFVNTYQGKSVKITSKEKIYMEADGESLGHSPFLYEILPRSLKVIVG